MTMQEMKKVQKSGINSLLQKGQPLTLVLSGHCSRFQARIIEQKERLRHQGLGRGKNSRERKCTSPDQAVRMMGERHDIALPIRKIGKQERYLTFTHLRTRQKREHIRRGTPLRHVGRPLLIPLDLQVSR